MPRHAAGGRAERMENAVATADMKNTFYIGAVFGVLFRKHMAQSPPKLKTTFPLGSR